MEAQFLLILYSRMINFSLRSYSTLKHQKGQSGDLDSTKLQGVRALGAAKQAGSKSVPICEQIGAQFLLILYNQMIYFSLRSSGTLKHQRGQSRDLNQIKFQSVRALGAAKQAGSKIGPICEANGGTIVANIVQLND